MLFQPDAFPTSHSLSAPPFSTDHRLPACFSPPSNTTGFHEAARFRSPSFPPKHACRFFPCPSLPRRVTKEPPCSDLRRFHRNHGPLPAHLRRNAFPESHCARVSAFSAASAETTVRYLPTSDQTRSQSAIVLGSPPSTPNRQTSPPRIRG